MNEEETVKRQVYVFEFYWPPDARFPGPHTALVRGHDEAEARALLCRKYEAGIDGQRLQCVAVLDYDPLVMM